LTTRSARISLAIMADPRGRPATQVVLTDEQRSALERVLRAETSARRDVRRAQVILAAADGEDTVAIAARLHHSCSTVVRWRKRFAASGMTGLLDQPRKGRPPRITPVQRCEIIAAACQPPPQADGETGWTRERLRRAILEQGIVDALSVSHLGNLLLRADIKPHKTRMWLHSTDPQFRERVAEIIALYLNPPKGEVVVCIDEKTGMQAVERKHPDGPARPGELRRREFEYIRHGTQTLIASFEITTGEVLSYCGATRKGPDLEAFMERVAVRYPTGRVHVVWDNLNTHVDRERWASFNARHGGRFVFHFTPKHASWVNQIELWFGIFAKRSLRNASLKSVEELRALVEAFVERWNRLDKHPFSWTFKGYPLEEKAPEVAA
jgi:transposase